MSLIINGDKANPLEAVKDIEDPFFSRFIPINGADPQYVAFYTPDALGFIELQVVAEDDEGKQTYSNPMRYKVTNGEPPIVEIIHLRKTALGLWGMTKKNLYLLLQRLRIQIGRSITM